MTKVCSNDNCNREFQARRSATKYCSHSCAASITNLGRIRKNWDDARTCLYCNKSFVANKKAQVFCSVICSNRGTPNSNVIRASKRFEEWQRGQTVQGWKSHNVPVAIRNGLLKYWGYQCTMILDSGNRCPENRLGANGKSILQLDHIDGNPENNTYENIRLVCPSCHATTSTFGNQNAGNGRKWRRINVPVAEK